MNTNRKATSIKRLARLLNDDGNLSTEYVRYLGKLSETADPRAARVIARYLDVGGVVGHCAARSLVWLARSSDECREVVLRICERRIERSLDSDEIRNAQEVCDELAQDLLLRDAA